MHQVHACYSGCQCLKQKSIKHNTGITGNDMRIKKNNGQLLWEKLEGIIGKVSSILGSGLATTANVEVKIQIPCNTVIVSLRKEVEYDLDLKHQFNMYIASLP